MFQRVLVANRGEIARRIIRTLDALGIESVAVYSEGDADAPHVREATRAVCIGPDPAAESYLKTVNIIEAALKTGAEAIHPGYGFLSESVELAKACEDSGIVFIGPRTRALEIMGDKVRAREHLKDTEVPMVPGFADTERGERLTDAAIADHARDTGYPLLVKPSAGGGGKGMQMVRSEDELRGALGAARRISGAAFGDEGLLLERLIERPRHIEVQVFGTATGEVLALGERECTLQRRHQKVIEESPNAGGLSEETVDALILAATRVARSVDYLGAGTIEFLVDADRPDDFFFIEMNTRLQVEHPVTEAVLGIDLVELQIRTAYGEDVAEQLSDAGHEFTVVPGETTGSSAGRRLTPQGHAVEARIYAETPEQGFLPSVGTILWWDEPLRTRVDAALGHGDTVSAMYDPMIAKLITHADTRELALEALDEALSETAILGVDTNISFLRALIAHDRVQLGDLDTGLIETMLPFHAVTPPTEVVEAVARAFAEMETWNQASGGAGLVWWSATARTTPLMLRTGRPHTTRMTTVVDAQGTEYEAPSGSEAEYRETSGYVGSDGEIVLAVESEDDLVGAPALAVWAAHEGATWRFTHLTRRTKTMKQLTGIRADGPAHCEAPMPGRVTNVHVADGARVTAGQPLVTIEAMKMEHPTSAPHAGIVTVKVRVGDQVRRGQELATVTREEEPA